MKSREIISTNMSSALVSLQDCLFNNPSFLVNCKVIILWIIQSFFYTLVQVLQGDEGLCLFLLQKKPTSETEVKIIYQYLGTWPERHFHLTCSCKISFSFALMSSCCCCSRMMAASACLRSVSSFSFWIRCTLKHLRTKLIKSWNRDASIVHC